MNIQTILSALPTQLSGKPESGTGQGQFALALNHAAVANSSQAGNASLPAQLNAMTVEGLPPPTMAAQQALLHALNAHATQPLSGEAELAQPDAQWDEIMARLALIEGSHQAPVITDLPALPQQALVDKDLTDPELTLPADAMSTELAEQPQAAALVAAAMTETQRQDSPLPGVNAQGTNATRPDMSALTTSSVSASPLAAQLAASAAAAGQEAEGDGEAPARPTDFTSSLAKVAAPQAGNELRAMAPDTARTGFVPEAASMGQPQPSGTAAGQANPTAQPALPSQASLSAPLQSPAWPGQLGQQLVQFARQGGEQQVEMRLNPAELGPLSVTLKVTEQGAQAQFLSAHAQVRQVLEQAIPQLREALAEQGISLGEASVGDHRRQDAQAFAGGEGRHGQSGTDQGEGIPAMDNDVALGTATPMSLDGRVNLYA